MLARGVKRFLGKGGWRVGVRAYTCHHPRRKVRLMTFAVGDLVRISDDSRSSYGIMAGMTGDVRANSFGDILVAFPESSYNSVYVAEGSLDYADLSTLTDLDKYRRAVVRVMYRHKIKNGWCSAAETLATILGVTDLLPRQAEVVHTIVTSVPVWPGQENHVTIANAVRQIGDENRRHRETSTIRSTTDVYDDQGVDSRIEDAPDCLDTFKAVLLETALAGAREYEVAGVTDFLLEAGFAPEDIRESRTVTVRGTVEVTVMVGPDEDVAEMAVSSGILPDGFNVDYVED